MLPINYYSVKLILLNVIRLISSYILVNIQISIILLHNFIHKLNAVISTYQQCFPHYPQFKFNLHTFLCVKHTTIYR